jgi:DNA invertase Pin-like site-specific DNA recombinase
MIYGYARVSTAEQNLDGQLTKLNEAGCVKVYAEKITGSNSDRAELTKLMKKLRSGDTLVVTRLDRLARSTRDLLNILHMLGESGIGFKSLAEPMIDTTSAHGKLVFSVLASISEFERSLIRTRTDEGRRRAMARGIRFGRKPKMTDFQKREALERLGRGEVQADIARSYGVSQTTISFLSREL